jgi:hypothetical protein
MKRIICIGILFTLISPGIAEEHVAARVVHFPRNASLGKLYIQDVRAKERAHARYWEDDSNENEKTTQLCFQ